MAAKVVDRHVAGDSEQPPLKRSQVPVISTAALPRPLKGCRCEVLSDVGIANPVRKEAVDLREQVPVDIFPIDGFLSRRGDESLARVRALYSLIRFPRESITPIRAVEPTARVTCSEVC